MALAIRTETPDDVAGIRVVNSLAFERDDEANLVDALRSEGCVRLSLVAVAGKQVIGHILFSKLKIVRPDATVEALALAPLAVLPEFQRQGIGSALMRQALEQCASAGNQIVLVLGWPDYYARFGFSAALARPLTSPYAGDHFMALELASGALAGVTGEVVYARPFSDL